MARRRSILAAIMAFACTGIGVDAQAYNEPGHLETVRLLVDRLPAEFYTLDDKRVLVACSQMPDMVEGLDAARLYFKAFSNASFQWLRWAVADTLSTDALKRMFAVHHLLHGLTGGDSNDMHVVALALVGRLAVPRGRGSEGTDESRFESLCASGMSLHLLGDSLAHTQLAWDNDAHWQTMKMYPTGRGHGLSDQHLPDYILCSFLTKGGWAGKTSCNQDWSQDNLHERLARWQEFWAMGGALLTGRAVTPNPFKDAEIKELEQRLRSIRTGRTAGLENGYAERNDIGAGDAIVAFLSAHAPHDSVLDDFTKTARSADAAVTDQRPRCNDVLATIAKFSENRVDATHQVPSCARVWKHYAQAAIPAFTAAVCKGKPANSNAAGPVDSDWKGYYCESGADGRPEIERFGDLVFLAR